MKDLFSSVFKNENYNVEQSRRYLISFTRLTVVFSLFYGFHQFFKANYATTVILWVSAIIYFFIPLLLKRGLSIKNGTHLYVIAGSTSVIFAALTNGKILSPTLSFFIFAPLLPLLIVGRKTSFYYLIMVIAILVVFFILSESNIQIPDFIEGKGKNFFFFSVYLGLILLTYFYVSIFDSVKTTALNNLDDKNKELDKAQHELQKANEYKDRFIANVSHELRTPMHAILGFSEIINKRNLSEEKVKEYSEYINNSANNLIGIINDLLDLTKISVGEFGLMKEIFNPNKILYDVQRVFEVHTKNKDIQIRVTANFVEDFLVYADKSRITQIITNLISNAIKNTERGFIDLKASFNKSTEKLIFEIQDTGIGIPEEELQNIFESFYQVNSENTRTSTGLGLGLSIVKLLVDQMNGLIDVSSTVGVGTQFRIEVPAELIEPDLNDNNKELADDDLLNYFKTKKILVVDDNEINLIVLEEMMTDLVPELEIDSISNPLLTENKIKSKKYDFALIDIHMPQILGTELVEQIRKYEIEHMPKLIALTASITTNEVNEYLSHGFDDCIGKPFDKWDLLNRLRILNEENN